MELLFIYFSTEWRILSYVSLEKCSGISTLLRRNHLAVSNSSYVVYFGLTITKKKKKRLSDYEMSFYNPALPPNGSDAVIRRDPTESLNVYRRD